MGNILKKLTFAGTIFIVSHYIFTYLVDFTVWFMDIDQERLYIQNRPYSEFLIYEILPYLLAFWLTIRYIKKVFYIPSIFESIRWLISFVFFSWGWFIIQYFWDLY